MNRKDLGIIALMLAVLIGCGAAAGQIGKAQQEEETAMIRDAVRRATLNCYAVEGAYPADVEYLREHYRLAYDESRYIVTLDSFASNTIPDIYVMERGADRP